MPPLPLSTATQVLTTRLTALSESHKAVGQLTQRLAKLEGDVRLELSAEIHETLKGIEEELELLRQEVEDVVGTGGTTGRRRDSRAESERSRLAVLLVRLTEDLRSSRSEFRKAQLAAKHNTDRAKLKERELLFSTSVHQQRKQTPNSTLSEGEIVAQASSDVTAALRRTQQLMQQELSRSRFVQETLDQSTAALADLGEKYTDLNTLLSNSKNLVSTLLKSTKSDTWYLETTFYILLTTIIWLIFRRWLYGPLTWFLIWPLKLTFRIIYGFFGLATASTAAKSSTSLPSTSLIVQPSATGGIPRHNINPNQQQPYVRVGGGGRGYMHNSDPSPPGSYSQHVGKMAENQQQQAEEVLDHPQFRQQTQQEDDGPVRRGDGTILQESDKPRNPKKKMWEENVESAKHEAKQGQGQQQVVEGHGEAQGSARTRDEL